MCEFCTKHGEGKKWYLNVKNYSNDLLNDINRRNFVEKHFYWIDEMYRRNYNILKKMPINFPLIRGTVKAIIRKMYLYKHWGQVIPIEDIEEILSFTNSITRIPCGCRMATTGKESRLCFLVSFDPSKIGLADIVDTSYFGGPDLAKFEKVSKEWALDFMKKSEHEGMIHTVWAFKAPFVGGFCNCDSSGCLPMMMYRDAVPVIFRSEYIATVDKNDCTGCGKCVKQCQFNAISLANNDKAVVDNKRCYGCGICRSTCPSDAIRLSSRAANPKTASIWH